MPEYRDNPVPDNCYRLPRRLARFNKLPWRTHEQGSPHCLDDYTIMVTGNLVLRDHDKNHFPQAETRQLFTQRQLLNNQVMKILKDHVILYDDECPVCDLYTNAFVKTGMLDKEGRKAFSTADAQTKNLIDVPKACNEIALINRKTGEVKYGLDSLLMVIGNSFPVLKGIFQIRGFRWLFKKFYSFISYNRKVIIPGKKNLYSCNPAYNLKYRVLYIIVTWVVTAFVLNSYTPLLEPVVPAGGFYREFLVCGGQLIFQATLLIVIKKNNILEYLGNMMTVSLGGALLLLAIMPLHNLITSPWFFSVCFMLVAGLMLLEHIRRVKLLGLPWTTTLSWVIYRLLVLALIITV